MVVSSQIGCIKSEFDPQAGCEAGSRNLVFFSQSIANSQVAGDVLFPAKVARYMHLISEAANKKRTSSEAQ
jgi:hypothetical protein